MQATSSALMSEVIVWFDICLLLNTSLCFFRQDLCPIYTRVSMWRVKSEMTKQVSDFLHGESPTAARRTLSFVRSCAGRARGSHWMTRLLVSGAKKTGWEVQIQKLKFCAGAPPQYDQHKSEKSEKRKGFAEVHIYMWSLKFWRSLTGLKEAIVTEFQNCSFRWVTFQNCCWRPWA